MITNIELNYFELIKKTKKIIIERINKIKLNRWYNYYFRNCTRVKLCFSANILYHNTVNIL